MIDPLLYTVKGAVGNLDRVKQVVRLFGMVNAFTFQASD